jgi:hypothetical protein
MPLEAPVMTITCSSIGFWRTAMAISFIVLKVSIVFKISWNVDQRDGRGGVPTAALAGRG